MLAYHGDRLRRGNVVTRIPVLFAGSIEVLFNDLLPAGNSISSAHRKSLIIAAGAEQHQLPLLVHSPDYRERIAAFA